MPVNDRVKWTAGLIAVIVSLLCTACSNEPDSSPEARSDSVVTVAGLPADSGLSADTLLTTSIAAPTVLFVEATEAEIDAARKGVSKADFAVVADDLMYYRASAAELLERWHIPFTRLTGRRALRFTINDMPERIDFRDVTTLDFIVVYLSNKKPRIFAPNEIDSVRAYWQSRFAVGTITSYATHRQPAPFVSLPDHQTYPLTTHVK